MNNSTIFSPFNFERYRYGQAQAPYNTSDANLQNSYWGGAYSTNGQSSPSSVNLPINATQQWKMLFAFFAKNNTFATSPAPKPSITASTPSVSKESTDNIELPVWEGPVINIEPVKTGIPSVTTTPSVGNTLTLLPLIGGDLITPAETSPNTPFVTTPASDAFTLPIWGGGDFSNPKSTNPFLDPSMNDIFQTITYRGTVATGQKSGYWGDPHVNDADRKGNESFIVTGPGTYSLLKDKNIALSAEHKKYANWSIEVTNQIDLALGDSKVVFNAYGEPTLNGQIIEKGKLLTLPDGSAVNWNGSKLSVTNANYGEYNLEIQLQDWGALNKDGSRIKYLDTWINSTDKGVFSDGILPTGILGEGFDMDNIVRTKLNFGLENYKVS
jgi:hypothetical protein